MAENGHVTPGLAERRQKNTITLPRYFMTIVDSLVVKVQPVEVDAIFGYISDVMKKRGQ